MSYKFDLDHTLAIADIHDMITIDIKPETSCSVRDENIEIHGYLTFRGAYLTSDLSEAPFEGSLPVDITLPYLGGDPEVYPEVIALDYRVASKESLTLQLEIALNGYYMEEQREIDEANSWAESVVDDYHTEQYEEEINTWNDSVASSHEIEAAREEVETNACNSAEDFHYIEIEATPEEVAASLWSDSVEEYHPEAPREVAEDTWTNPPTEELTHEEAVIEPFEFVTTAPPEESAEIAQDFQPRTEEITFVEEAMNEEVEALVEDEIHEEEIMETTYDIRAEEAVAFEEEIYEEEAIVELEVEEEVELEEAREEEIVAFEAEIYEEEEAIVELEVEEEVVELEEAREEEVVAFEEEIYEEEEAIVELEVEEEVVELEEAREEEAVACEEEIYEEVEAIVELEVEEEEEVELEEAREEEAVATALVEEEIPYSPLVEVEERDVFVEEIHFDDPLSDAEVDVDEIDESELDEEVVSVEDVIEERTAPRLTTSAAALMDELFALKRESVDDIEEDVPGAVVDEEEIDRELEVSELEDSDDSDISEESTDETYESQVAHQFADGNTTIKMVYVGNESETLGGVLERHEATLDDVWNLPELTDGVDVGDCVMLRYEKTI